MYELNKFSKKKYFCKLNILIKCINSIIENNYSVYETTEKVINLYIDFENISNNNQNKYKDLKLVQNLANNYESLQDFISDITLESFENLKEDIIKKEHSITISTIHSAKGLE